MNCVTMETITRSKVENMSVISKRSLYSAIPHSYSSIPGN